MRPTSFNPETDLPPIPFDERHCLLAAALKDAGLQWRPHVGCFVWDRDRQVPVDSPFPKRIYFILNLGHFMRLLGSLEEIASKLIWLPTWHQARILCTQRGVGETRMVAVWQSSSRKPGEELIELYEVLLETLQRRNTPV